MSWPRCKFLIIHRLARLELGYQSKGELKRWVKGTIRDKVKEDLFREIGEMKSLRFYKTLQEDLEPAFHLSVLNTSQRRTVSWFRLGGFIWQGKKDGEGKRMCPCCENNDSIAHILSTCPSARELQKTLGVDITPWGVRHWFLTRDKTVVASWANYLSEVKRVREGNLL